jgi:hypothetical protein
MVASLLRVLHSGAQDTRLLHIKGRPSIDFFTTVFRRAGRFTTQWVRLDFDYRPILGQQAGLTIPRKGHLLSRLYLVTTLPNIRQYEDTAKAQQIPTARLNFDVGDDIDVSGNIYKRINSTGSPTTGISSVQSYLDPCYFEFTVDPTQRGFTVALSYNSATDGNVGGSFYGITFGSVGLSINLPGVAVSKFQSTNIGPALPGEVFRIEFDGINVNFLRNSLMLAASSFPYKNPLYAQVNFTTTLASVTVLAFSVITSFAGPTFNYTNNLGHAVVQQASIDIAGTRVENLDGKLLEVLDEFYTPLEKTTIVNPLLQRYDNGFNIKSVPALPVVVTPLPFWFSRGDSGVALPIDAIQADPVKLNVTFAPITNLYISSGRQPYVASASVAAGAAYFPLLGSKFYYQTPLGVDLSGVLGDPKVATKVLPVNGVSVPLVLPLGDTYVMAEYIYLDRPEANRFRIADIQVPIVQHYRFDPYDTQSFARVQIPLRVPNPTRSLFFFAQRYDATAFNAPFLVTRDVSGFGTSEPWWPDARGLNSYYIQSLKPGFSTRNSEPLAGMSLVYEGKYVRYKTDAPVNFRSVIPSMEMRKSPWVNRYMYAMPFGYKQGRIEPSLPSGEANLDKMHDIFLNLVMHPRTGSVNANDVDGFLIYVWAETYNILRVYGGRAGLMMAY